MRRILAATLVALTATLLLPLTATTESGLPRRYSADAFFQGTLGCVNTFVGVYPVAYKDRQTGRVVGGSMSMQLEQFDTCINAFLLQASPGVVTLSPGEFEMSPGLNKASLHTAAVSMHDAVSGRDFTVSIDLTYRAVGPRSDCTEDVFSDETTTFCTAIVDGIVTDGTINWTLEPGDAVFQEHRSR